MTLMPIETLLKIICVAWIAAATLAGCRPWQDGGALPEENSELSQARIFNLSLASTSESEDAKLSPKASYSVSSPLSIVTVRQLNELKRLEMSLLDFHADGSLANLADRSLSSRHCFRVGIYSLLTASNAQKILLLSTFQDGPTVGLNEAIRLGDFSYCEEGSLVKIILPDEKVGASLIAYLNQRGLRLNSPRRSHFGSLLRRLELNEAKRAKRSENSSLKKQDVKNPIGAGRFYIEHVAYITPTSPLRGVITVEPNPIFAPLREVDIWTQMQTNRIESKFYKKLVREKQIEIETKAFGVGANATVYKAKIGDTIYVIRKERISSKLRGSERDDALADFYKARNNLLLQNEFIKAFPNSNFVRTELSCVTKEEEFITVLELREGGDLQKALERGDQDPIVLEQIADQLTKQLAAYHMGIPFNKDGQDYSASLVHGDVKPANVIMDVSGTASFIDFGTSEILLKAADSSGTHYRLVTAKDGQTTLRELEVASAASSKVEALDYDGILLAFGTPNYLAPEFYSEEIFDFKGVDAAILLKNNDLYAANCMRVQLLTGSLPTSIQSGRPTIGIKGRGESRSLMDTSSFSSRPSNEDALTKWKLEVNLSFETSQ